jgi:probable F420-dependent oxidoreductase
MPVKVDVTLGGELSDVPATAAALEAQGWDALWTAEMAHDPFLPLAVAATCTSRVRLGTAIAVAFARSPMDLAYTAWDLQRASAGRFALGLGSQVKPHIERRFSMPWSRPAARMREYVLALRAIWSAWQDGTPLEFRGEFYAHTLMTPAFSPDPLPAPPEVFLAAVGPAMSTVAGEVADGLLAHGFTTAHYLAEVVIPAAERGLAAAGKDRAGFSLRWTPFVVTGRDQSEVDKAARAARDRIAFYASTPAYRPVLEIHGWGDLQPRLQAMTRAGEWDQMADLIDDEVLDAFAVVATPEALPDAFAARVAGLSDRVTVPVQTITPEVAAAMRDTLRSVPAGAARG